MTVIIVSKSKALRFLGGIVFLNDVCYYLSDDYYSLVKIRKSVIGKCEINTLDNRFHKAIVEIEKDYLRFCHSINLKNQSENYWGNHLASRNSASIPLLRYMAYLYCARQIIKDNHSRVIFICDSIALANVICSEVRERGKECQMVVDSKSFNLLQLYSSLLKRSVIFLAYYLARWFYVRSFKNYRISDNVAKTRYLFRSWVTIGCLDEKGEYKDRNFGILPQYLRECDKDVWTIPLFFNLGKKVFTYLKLMANSSPQFIFPEQYLKMSDGFRTLWDGIKGLFIDFKDYKLMERDVSKILREVHLKNSLSPNLLMYNSDKYLLQRLSKKGIKIDYFVYPIENNACEKPFILAIRRFYPHAKIIGFQHSVWFKEQLGMFLCPEELSYHPLPDKIVCSGRRYLGVLNEAGFPIDKLSWGPNLRYTMINKFSNANRHNNSSGIKGILVLLDFDINHAMEMLEKLKIALNKMGEFTVYIKSHPLVSVKQLGEYLRDINFPRYEWAEGSVQEWVAKSKAVIMTGGSVSNLETMAMGVPLLRVSLENNFDFDPLWDEYPFAPFVSTPEEISSNLMAAFNLSETKRNELIEFGNKVIENYFEPVTQERLRVFL